MFAEAFFEKTNQQVVSKPGTWVAVTVRIKRRLTGAEGTTVTQSSGEIDLSAGLSPCASRVCSLGLLSFGLGREQSSDKDCLMLWLVASRLFALSHPLLLPTTDCFPVLPFGDNRLGGVSTQKIESVARQTVLSP